NDKRNRYFANGIVAGSMVMIEVPGRRLELGLYCLPRALESFWNCGVQWGWWKNIPYVQSLFCVVRKLQYYYWRIGPDMDFSFSVAVRRFTFVYRRAC